MIEVLLTAALACMALAVIAVSVFVTAMLAALVMSFTREELLPEWRRLRSTMRRPA